MRKFLFLLLIIPSISISAQYDDKSDRIYKIVKDVPDNSPATFWQMLSANHPQKKAMRKAAEKHKPAMGIAIQELGDIHQYREPAEEYSITDFETIKMLSDFSVKAGLKGALSTAKLFLIHDPEPNACMFPDGTCIINDGLFEFVQNKDEIIGVLAHEIAHMVLWHSLNDLWRTAKAVRRNQMWAEIGTGLAMGAYAYSQVNSAQYGVAQSNEAQQRMYENIAEAGANVREEIGARTNIFTRLRYMRDTEEEADEVAFWFLEKNGIDPQHLINFFKRLDDATPIELKKAKNKTKYSDHPDMEKRIKKLVNLYNSYHKK